MFRLPMRRSVWRRKEEYKQWDDDTLKKRLEQEWKRYPWKLWIAERGKGVEGEAALAAYGITLENPDAPDAYLSMQLRTEDCIVAWAEFEIADNLIVPIYLGIDPDCRRVRGIGAVLYEIAFVYTGLGHEIPAAQDVTMTQHHTEWLERLHGTSLLTEEQRKDGPLGAIEERHPSEHHDQIVDLFFDIRMDLVMPSIDLLAPVTSR